MRGVLMGMAALAALGAVPAAPAAAEEAPVLQFHGGGFGKVLTARPAVPFGEGIGDRRRGRGGTSFVYDRGYQGDSAFKSDGFNDWWHDRPDRAFPRWMNNNDGCQRLWWSGGGWRC